MKTVIASLMVGAAVSMGALFATTPAAHAEKISENTIKAECKSAGGRYSTAVIRGGRFSTCRYSDISGGRWVDYYADGSYYSTHPD